MQTASRGETGGVREEDGRRGIRRPALCIIKDWALEAHDDERNHHRRYQVTIGPDLLDT